MVTVLAIVIGVLALLLFYVSAMSRVRAARLKYALVLPAFVILFATTVIPIGYMLYSSFFRLDPVSFNGHWPFLGLANYRKLLELDSQFWPSLLKTVEFLVGTIVPQVAVGMFLAVILFRDFAGKRLVQTILLLPILSTPIIIAMIWKYFFNVDTGFINLFLESIGIPGQPWLSTRGLPWVQAIPLIGPWMVKNLSFTYAFQTIIFVNFWQWTPFCFLIFYSGMTALPAEIYDAAKVDGAGTWQEFVRITLPLLSRIIWVVVLLRMIDCLKVFAQIWVLFGNADSTAIINIELYTLGFITSNYGMASALGILVLLLITIVVFATTRLTYGERRE